LPGEFGSPPDINFQNDDWIFHRVGKARAGHLLDGKTHTEFPEEK
jgi:hypothetical protein